MLPGESKLTMVLPLDDLGNNLNNGERNNKFRTFLRPFSEEEQHLPDVEKNTIDQRDTQITEKIPVIKNETEVVKPEYPGKREENPTSFFRTLIKSSGIYALSSMASPLIALILAPFLTRNLSHSEYGALVILNTAIALIAGITQLGLSSAFFRAYNYDYETKSDRLRVLSTVVLLLSLTSMCTVFTIMIAAPWLSMLLFNSESFSNAVRIAGVVILLQNLTVPGFAWMRAESRAMFFSMLSIANLLIALGANVILVGALHMGVEGSLIATGCGFAFVVICTLPIIVLRSGLHLHLHIAHGLLTFGLPNVSTYVSVWVLQLSDRYLLGRLGSLSQTASYAVAYSLGGVVSVVVLSPFTLAWPAALFSIAKKDDAANIFRLVFRWYSFILLFATFALSLVGMIVLNVFFPPSYQSAAFIIPIIALSTMFFGVYNIFTTGIAVKRKTWFAVVFTTVAALVNVGLNLLLIPHYGAFGAALSTLLAYAILALIAYRVNQRIYPIPYEISTFIIALIIGIGFFTGGIFLSQNQGTYEAWGISLGALGLYSGCLVLLAKLSSRWGKDTTRLSKGSLLS
jgi:O-antigen/teichoic acid export membrane protein